VLRAHSLNDSLYRPSTDQSSSPSYYTLRRLVGIHVGVRSRNIEGFMRRAKRSSFSPPDTASFEELCETADDKLFNKIQNNEGHILYTLLLPTSIASQNYSLRYQAHNRQLTNHSGYLTDCNFITHMLYKNMYLITQTLHLRKYYANDCECMNASAHHYYYKYYFIML